MRQLEKDDWLTVPRQDPAVAAGQQALALNPRSVRPQHAL